MCNDTITINRIKRLHKSYVGNWAGWDKTSGLSFCGWMDFHDDKDEVVGGGATQEKPIFTLEVKYATANGKLVYQENNKFVAKRLRAGMTICFNARKLHAFLPCKIADECVKYNSIEPQMKIGFDLDDITSKADTDVRIIWKFKE